MKMLHRLILLPLFMAATCAAIAQPNKVILDYIENYKDLAIEEMQRTGVPASIKLAQGIHETMAGTSNLVQRSNNHFGIKCKANWTGPSVSHDDDARGECFRKYPSAMDSYRDHSNFLKGSARYAGLFQLEPTNYTGWAHGLKKAGYATNPKYPVIIIRLIEEYSLQDFTLIAMGKMKAEESITARIQNEPDQEMEPVNAVTKTEVPVAEPTIYPQSDFWINDTRVVFMRRGTSYLSIAQQYNVSLSRLFDFNEITESEVADRDQLVYLQRKRKTGKDEYHIVKAGESLHDIAQQQGIRLESLLEYNWLRKNAQPAIGERLALRGKSDAMPRLALKEDRSVIPAGKRWK